MVRESGAILTVDVPYWREGEKTHTKGMGQASQVTIQDMNMSEDLFSNTTCQLGMTGMAIYTRICASLDYFYLRKV